MLTLSVTARQQFEDFYDLFVNGEVDKDIELQPEDILYLPTNEKNKVYVVGAVIEPKLLSTATA